jgi:hypothetical protein
MGGLNRFVRKRSDSPLTSERIARVQGGIVTSRGEAVGEKNYASLDGVKKWFARHGYSLELQTARQFQRAGFDVAHGAFYRDPESDKPREIDVVATKDALGGTWWIRVTFVIECKSGQNQSWALLGSPASSVDGIGRLTVGIHSERAGMLGAYLRRRSPVGEASLWKRSQNPARGLVRIGEGNDDLAFAAMVSVVKAAVAQLEFANSSEELGDPLAEFVFPVIVIDSPLYRVNLDEHGDMAYTALPSGAVSWRHPSAKRHLTVIDIVTVDDLPAFVEEAAACAALLLEHAEYAVRTIGPVGDD